MKEKKNNKGILSQASKKEHIVDQWFELYTIILENDG